VQTSAEVGGVIGLPGRRARIAHFRPRVAPGGVFGGGVTRNSRGWPKRALGLFSAKFPLATTGVNLRKIS